MKIKLGLSVVVLLGASLAAFGGTVTFDFNTGLSVGQTAGSIATYMTNALVASGCVGCSVTVNNGLSSSIYVDQTYNGEGHAVAPGVSPTKSTTLGTTDGAAGNNVAPNSTYDNFISNVSDGSSKSVDRIVLHFNGLVIQGSVSFDFEIFPDGTCPSITNCGGGANMPDFILQSGINGVDSNVNSFGTNGKQLAVAPGSGNGNSTDSPLTGAPELAPQYIGKWSTSSALNGNNDILFIDWPAGIAVDNLVVNYSKTPEPGSLFLLSTILGGLFVAARKLRRG